MEKIVLLIGLGVLIAIAGCLTENEEHAHDYSVEIEGSEMRSLTVQEVADLWEIDANLLLSKIIAEFDLKETYTVNTALDEMREEYKFSPAIIKDMAEELKKQNE